MATQAGLIAGAFVCSIVAVECLMGVFVLENNRFRAEVDYRTDRCEPSLREHGYSSEDYKPFCQNECKKESLLELTGQYLLSDYNKAVELSNNKCGE